MAQGFSCFCGAATCRGFISGAKNMKPEQLDGMWLNAHIRSLLEERDGVPSTSLSSLTLAPGSTEKEKDLAVNGTKEVENGTGEESDLTEEALKSALDQARRMVDAAQKALDTYKSLHGRSSVDDLAGTGGKGAVRQNGVGSRELSGEMGGDTKVEV
jgi:hypothetical protein